MLFANVDQAPADPILGLTDAFKADPRPNKVNLGVGIYKDEQGNTPVLATVKKAEAVLLEKEKTKSYLAIEGVADYAEEVKKLLLGSDSAIISEGRINTAQAPGGTGSLRVAAEFLKSIGDRTVWLSNPTWANHGNIFNAAGLTTAQYDYYDAASHGLNFDGMLASLQQAQAGDIVLLHGCCHNPTGIDLNLEQWQQVAKLCVEKDLLPLFDFAYQGFAKGVEEDAAGLREVASIVPEIIICNSFSKNFGLYNERVGAISIVAQDAEQSAKAFSQIKKQIRSIYSNPPAHGAKVVAEILADASLRAEWEQEVADMRVRIHKMRSLFVEQLAAAGVQQDFGFIIEQNGMFSFSGLSKEQVEALKQEHAIYIVGSGRISVAGMTQTNMPLLIAGIKAVL
ncbi:amino acid aminotransferase [Paraferrimonas sp. SM1919]|uniref:amino acid aminotransferase n=1 Tax=Paraferrimonas sp. SM1919 TaxID=2662263 RepID=UPI0013D6A70E|nr:amino acid aminotransferase [Paraferrimonas sp. SM1919]